MSLKRLWGQQSKYCGSFLGQFSHCLSVRTTAVFLRYSFARSLKKQPKWKATEFQESLFQAFWVFLGFFSYTGQPQWFPPPGTLTQKILVSLRWFVCDTQVKTTWFISYHYYYFVSIRWVVYRTEETSVYFSPTCLKWSVLTWFCCCMNTSNKSQFETNT